jgi:hypothetical protein
MTYEEVLKYVSHTCEDTFVMVNLMNDNPPFGRILTNPCIDKGDEFMRFHSRGHSLISRFVCICIKYKDQLCYSFLSPSEGLCWMLTERTITRTTGEHSGLYLMLNAETEQYSSDLQNEWLTEGTHTHACTHKHTHTHTQIRISNIFIIRTI